MTEEERRRLWGLAWAVREFGEEGLVPGAVSELASGVLALIEELPKAQASGLIHRDPSDAGEAKAPANREPDHSTEEAVRRAFEQPTPQNQHDAELAVAHLQRRFEHVLWRLDGSGEVPPYPVHRHDAAEYPVDRLHAVLEELAGATLADRAETLAHGLDAARALEHQLAEARAWARGYEHGYFEDVDTDSPPAWLTAPLRVGRGERDPGTS